jgi:hypothetical protein
LCCLPAAEEATMPPLDAAAMDIDPAAAAAAGVSHVEGQQRPAPPAAAFDAADVGQDVTMTAAAPGVLVPPSASLPSQAAAAEGSAAGSMAVSSSSSMPVQNFGLVLQLHRRWVLYQLQQMGRAALSPLSTAKRAVSDSAQKVYFCCKVMLGVYAAAVHLPW